MDQQKRDRILRIALEQAQASSKGRSNVVSGGSDTYDAKVADKLEGAGIIKNVNKPDYSKVKAVPITAKQRDKEELEIERLEKELIRADERLTELMKHPIKNKREIEILKEKMNDPRLLRKREKESIGFESIVPVEEEIKDIRKKQKRNTLDSVVDQIMEEGDDTKAHNAMVIMQLSRRGIINQRDALDVLKYIYRNEADDFAPHFNIFNIPDHYYDLFIY